MPLDTLKIRPPKFICEKSRYWNIQIWHNGIFHSILKFLCEFSRPTYHKLADFWVYSAQKMPQNGKKSSKNFHISFYLFQHLYSSSQSFSWTNFACNKWHFCYFAKISDISEFMQWMLKKLSFSLTFGNTLELKIASSNQRKLLFWFFFTSFRVP